MTNEINKAAADNATRLMQGAIRSEVQRIAIQTGDYANWDEAYEWVSARNDAAIDANIGTGATESGAFDLIFILTPDGEILYAYESEGAGNDPSHFDATVIGPLLRRLSTVPVTPYQTVSAFAIYDGTPVVLAAGRVQPYEAESLLGAADLPVMIGGTILGAELVGSIGRNLLLEEVSIVSPEAVPPADASLPLAAVDGTTSAVLTWQAPRPGDALLKRSIAIIAALSFLMISMSIVIGRSTARQAAAYMHERVQARTDPLTGLMNRAGLEEMTDDPDIERAIANGNAAVLYLDVNDFKQLNDAVGHEVGDRALRLVADRLRRSMRHSDKIARIGGDEFVALILDDTPEEAARIVCERIALQSDVPLRLARQGYHVRPSIGVSVANVGSDWDGLLIEADSAMYEAKKTGQHTVFFKSGNGRKPTVQPVESKSA